MRGSFLLQGTTMKNFVIFWGLAIFAQFCTITNVAFATSPEKSERIHAQASGFLLKIKKSGVIYTHYGIKRILNDEERQQFFAEIYSCSHYIRYIDWQQQNIRAFHIGHPIFASAQLLEDLSVGRITTNGCQDGEIYNFALKGLEYEKIFELLSELKSLDHNQRVVQINAAIFELISKKKLGKDQPDRIKLAYKIASSKVSGYDPSDIIRWGQTLLKEQGFDISVDGDFGSKSCRALKEALAKDEGYSCSETFRLDEIMSLIFTKSEK